MGVRSATVSIANDDSDENPYTFAIQALASLLQSGLDLERSAGGKDFSEEAQPYASSGFTTSP